MEWWEDVRDGGIGSQVVLLEVPRGWGRSRVLNDLTGAVEDADGPVTFTVPKVRYAAGSWSPPRRAAL